MKTRPAKTKAEITTSQNLETRFEAGEDVLDYFDLARCRRPALEAQRVNVDFPQWVVDALDREAQRLGITRQALIKVWIADRLKKAA